MSKMKTMKVIGKSTVSAAPTLMALSLEISADTKTFEAASLRSTQDTETFKDIVEGLGFKRSDLKTVRLDIETRNESYRDSNGDYRSRFAGYKYEHAMYLEFPQDGKRLGQILSALIASKIEFEFRVKYTMKNSEKEAYREELITKAVADATAKANMLAQASKVKLGDIIDINYTGGYHGDFEYDFMDSDSLDDGYSLKCASPNIEYSVDAKNIELRDQVHMVWLLKD